MHTDEKWKCQRMAEVQHDFPNEKIIKAQSFQPKNRGPGDSCDPI